MIENHFNVKWELLIMYTPCLLEKRISHISCLLEKGWNEYSYTIRLCLLSALSGGSVFLLGMPNVVKKLITRRLKFVFQHARVFEYSLAKNSLPEQGPVSYPILAYQNRNINGHEMRNYLSQADIVFFDEIWNANPKILNILTSAIDKKCHYEIRLFIIASSELPDDNNVFIPLYNRLLIRLREDNIYCKHITQLKFIKSYDLIPIELQVTNNEYLQWQREISLIILPDHIFELIFKLRKRFKNIVTASDRQWKKATRLLQASAFFNGRNTIAAIDLILLKECMWYNLQSLNFIQEQLSVLMTTEAWHQNTMLTRLVNIVKSHIESQLKNYKTRPYIMYECDIKNTKPYYSISNKVDIPIMTLLLQESFKFNNMEVMFITLNYSELRSWLVKGGDISGRLNGTGVPRLLKLKINKESYLVLYNEIMQSTQLIMLSGYMTREKKEQLEKLNNEWQKQITTFHKQQNLFIQHSWLSTIEASIQNIGVLIQQVRWGNYSFYCSQNAQRF
ncbi:DUF3763 domain-containing protein [Salmonella enterica]|nr:DUF3763 domain-containing protein [Salmonella enterica]ELJ4826244.1 DUF3763 domain-containing protein [Salmonella enterica]